MHETDFEIFLSRQQHELPLYRDRYDYDRQTILAECLRAWRVNPIARRIVKLVSMFVVGEGISVKSDHKATAEFLNSLVEVTP